MNIKTAATLVLVLVGTLGRPSFSMEKTWTGKISDSHCGATHKQGMLDKHAKEKTGAVSGKVDDRECTELCVKEGGKYVFAVKGKVYEISNQDFTGLPEHAGHTVKLTGEMTGKSIKVSKIDM